MPVGFGALGELHGKHRHRLHCALRLMCVVGDGGSCHRYEQWRWKSNKKYPTPEKVRAKPGGAVVVSAV